MRSGVPGKMALPEIAMPFSGDRPRQGSRQPAVVAIEAAARVAEAERSDRSGFLLAQSASEMKIRRRRIVEDRLVGQKDVQFVRGIERGSEGHLRGK